MENRHLLNILCSVMLLAAPTVGQASNGVSRSLTCDVTASGLQDDPNFALRLETYGMLRRYEHEVRDHGVRYLGEDERQSILARFDGDEIFIFDSNGQRFTLTRSGLSANYVMDANGNFYFDIGASLEKHSALLAGNPVAAAGYVIFHPDGSIEFNNFSGHYKPPRDTLRQVMGVLLRRGFDLSKVSVEWDNRFESDWTVETFGFIKVRGVDGLNRLIELKKKAASTAARE